jgi:hypothetical protein
MCTIPIYISYYVLQWKKFLRGVLDHDVRDCHWSSQVFCSALCDFHPTFIGVQERGSYDIIEMLRLVQNKHTPGSAIASRINAAMTRRIQANPSDQSTGTDPGVGKTQTTDR